MAPKKTKKKEIIAEEVITVEPIVEDTPTEETPHCTIVIKIDNATYMGSGATPLEALQAVPTPPLDFISSGTVTVTYKGSTREMLYSTIQLKRLLNPYHQEVLAHILTEGM